ncbi:hypothetical protein BX659_1386 [Orenia metallireducens]|jgi:hypothetical protein|uniref:Uncharacterized protein n=1 Tax=Orenia metallireducens TaxID=1413210 RepID=A0A285IDE4_9FIRM|nr:hypothetical protein BX659_1386 [Orenia metallireducens]SNY45962.1 hypothetical protein SAMN06265827_1406 [Orenia metallireducens]
MLKNMIDSFIDFTKVVEEDLEFYDLSQNNKN